MSLKRFYTLAVGRQLVRNEGRSLAGEKGLSLARLAVLNLLPTPLSLVPRENRFVKPVDMPVLDFQNPGNPPTSTTQVPWRITSSIIRPDLMHWAVVVHRAGLRAGLAAAKNRGRVSGGGRKLYPQKGTGRARAGSSRAPQRRGGGVCFGPRPRDFSQDLPVKIRLRALFSALSMKHQNGQMALVSSESLALDVPKTKRMVKCLEEVAPGCSKVLIIKAGPFAENTVRASRALSRRLALVDLEAIKDLPAHTVLNHRRILLTPEAVEHLSSRFK